MGAIESKSRKAHALVPLLRRAVRESPAAIVLGAISGLAASLLRLVFRGLEWCFTHSADSLPLTAASLPPVKRFLTPILGALFAILVLVLRRKNAHRLGGILGGKWRRRRTRGLDDPVRRRCHVLAPGTPSQTAAPPSAP